REYPAELQAASRTAEQALLDTPKPVPAPNILPVSESDEIRQRVSIFKAHQQKIAQEREEYYFRTKARMMASFPGPKENPLASTGGRSWPLRAARVAELAAETVRR